MFPDPSFGKLGRGLALALFIALVATAHAQVGVRVVHFNPYGELGEVVKKKVALELIFMDSFDEPLRFRASFGFHKLQPRLDVFPTVGYGYSDGQWTVYPGTMVYNKISIFSMTGGLDYAPIQFMDDRLSPYVGGSVVGGALFQDYESNTPGLSAMSDQVSNGFIGLQPRIGVDMIFGDHFGASLELACSFVRTLGAPNLTFSQHGLSVRYIF